jgi:NTP pyrophosphatase (non-canonical NTP hydrolase)
MQDTITQKLHPEYTLDDIQVYMKKMAEIRGFSQETAPQTMLVLLEEVGELAKAIRKNSGIKIDHTRIHNYDTVANEMADVCICLFMLANTCNINLFNALFEKELINSQRTWSTCAESTNK